MRNDSALPTPRAWANAIAVATTLALAACGGGGGGDSPPPAPTPPPAPAPEALFVPGNAWRGGMPSDAETLTADEFRRRQVAGDLQIVTPDTQQAQRSARMRQVDAERVFLEGKTDLGADAVALLAQARAAIDIEGEPVATLSGGQQVGLIDLGTRIEKAAADYRLARDPANALSAYELSYSLLPDEMKAQVPTPASLRGGTLDQIRQATVQMDAALAIMVNLDNTRLDPAALVTPVRPLNAGNGVDNGGACTPAGYVKRYWFPLRAFVAPVKDQGERGTCWAFAAIAAVESRERVQNNNAADLSEQFLVNKVKREWYENDFVDGGSAASALNGAVDRNQALLSEAGWTYNRATGRPDNAFDAGVAGTSASYSGACRNSMGAPYTGFCSETAHQSRRSCTSYLGIDFCGFNKVNFNGPGVAASRVRLIWSSGQSFNLNQYRALLSSGVSLVASFPVYAGFSEAPAGIVSDYRKQMRNKKGDLVDGSSGGHLVQIVGFISNEELSFPGAAAAEVGGGGYFIIRNSWGCSGDGGYYYVPADYVSSLFSTLEALDFDARRSARWNDEQSTPGGASGLAVDPKGSKLVDLRVADNLAGSFTVSHPVANYVRLTVTSDRDGKLFDGQWLVNAPVGGSLFANSLPVNFQTQGLSTLTITARYGAQVVRATKEIIVYNSPPSVRFETSGIPQQDENFVVNAVVTDRNEPNPAAMCAAMTWQISAPDTVVSGSGCTRVIRFGATGEREVRATTRDNEGRETYAIGTFNVAPPPVNPYPRITTFGVYSRDFQRIEGVIVGCTLNLVADNATVDLRRLGCKRALLGPDLSLYVSQLGIENPAAEALSYDWTYTAYYPSAAFAPRVLATRTATPAYDVAPIVFGARDTPYACTLDVRVNAPEAARSKSLRVWTGRCINVEDAPR